MIKKFLLTTLALTLFANVVYAENLLKEPQGRIGTYFKTEKITYPPTNLSKQELELLHKNIEKYISEDTSSAKKSSFKKQLSDNPKENSNPKTLQRQKIIKKNKIAPQQTKEEKELRKAKFEEQKQKDPNLSTKLEKKSTETNAKNIVQTTTMEPKEQDNITTPKYIQDNDTKNIVKEITTELSTERPQMLKELSTLWVSAVQKSDTVYFAIIKLSNPNGEEVNKNGFKKILEPILSAAPLVGQAFVNPSLTAGSIIGSNIMGTMLNDGMKTRLAKVNDADLVILARAIDELQESLLMNYMAYKGAKEAYELAIKIAEERQKEYEDMNQKNSPNTILSNTFYTEALDYQYKTRQDFLMKRVVLEQMVGAEALNEIENPKQCHDAEQE